MFELSVITNKVTIMSRATDTQLQEKLKASAIEACVKQNYNPFQELVEMAQEKEKVIIKGKEHNIHICSTDQRISIAKEIASYISPKTKATDKDSTDFVFNISFTKFGETPELKVVEEAG